MLQCWDSQPGKRPTFSYIVNSLSQCLEAMAGYIDIVTFGEPKDLDLSKEKAQSPQSAQCETDKSQEVVVGTTHKETPL